MTEFATQVLFVWMACGFAGCFFIIGVGIKHPPKNREDWGSFLHILFVTAYRGPMGIVDAVGLSRFIGELRARRARGED